jgi:multidrug resistance efflux pump
VKQARGRARAAEARVPMAQQAVQAARAAVAQRQAEVDGASAALAARQAQLQRLQRLAAQNTVDQKLVEEKEQEVAGARSQVAAARAALDGARADQALKELQIPLAEAAVETARAGVEGAEADLQKAKTLLSLAQVRAPCDGVVSHRGYAVGDYVAAGGTGARPPLLTIERADRFRVVFRVAERDVPSVQVGGAAEVVLDALPGRRFTGRVARVAFAVDPRTRTMRAEIDLSDPQGQLRPGMAGTVTLSVGKASQESTFKR